MSEYILVHPVGGRVLSRMHTNPVYWGCPQLAQCVNYRYALKFPTGSSARAAASMHGGTPTPLER